MNRWIRKRESSRGRFRLFCFPYAGGNAGIYRDWQDRLPSDVEVCALELPGRRNRYNEEPFRSAPLLVEAIVGALTGYTDLPYGFFGHSLGAVVAYEVARCLRRAGQVGPGALFLSGAEAPHLQRHHRQIWRLPDDELVAEVRAFGGTAPEILDDPEIMRVFLPVLRADLEIFDTYMFRSEVDPLTMAERLPTPTWVLGGDADPRVSPARLAAWIDIVDVVSIDMFTGGHFFLHEQSDAVLATAARGLAQVLRAPISTGECAGLMGPEPGGPR